MADVLRSLNLLETLKEYVEKNKISDVRDAVEDLLVSHINIAVAGDRGPEKAAFINSLRGLSFEDEGAAPRSSSSNPEELALYQHTKYPNFRLWDLPGFSKDSKIDPLDYMEHFKLLRYNAVIFTFTASPHPNSVILWKKARMVQKETVYFALLATEKDTEKTMVAKKKKSVEELKAEGVANPTVYRVQPIALEMEDFPKLLEAMTGGLHEIRSHALLLALPAFSTAIVTQKRDTFKALVWAAASLSGGISTIPVPLVASVVDSGLAVRILSKAQTSLCLDDESIERLAGQRGKNTAQLKGLRTCVLSIEVTKSEVKRRLAAAEKSTSSTTNRLVELAMPRNARAASRSFTVMLQALNGAIDEMGVDAEKIVEMATGKGQ
ncbi:immunity-related GTPase family, q2 [Chanos chanos]|uniref:Immunity-related GTPase family, q2 n=1 Tax=Chanos chanos TaxID=29144 RepID=A0A6J2W1N9_CHACN|nr:interferon-inducible GTPase 5-like [Chanos chanos]